MAQDSDSIDNSESETGSNDPLASEPSNETRCPECESHFAVSNDQLSAAGGLVRCGQCQQVFNANACLIDVPELPLSSKKLAPSSPSTNTPSSQAEADSPVLHIERESLATEFNTNGEREPKKKRFPWFSSALALCLSLLLCAQYALFNWAALNQRAHQPDQTVLKQSLTLLCDFTHCTIAPPRELNALRSDSLHIREHTDFQNSLQADFILYNQADRELLAPNIHLSFSDISGIPIASRSFDSSEYLFGDMKGLTLLPANSEIRIQLNILDPDPDAVNYRLDLSYPNEKLPKSLKLLQIDRLNRLAKAFQT